MSINTDVHANTALRKLVKTQGSASTDLFLKELQSYICIDFLASISFRYVIFRVLWNFCENNRLIDSSYRLLLIGSSWTLLLLQVNSEKTIKFNCEGFYLTGWHLLTGEVADKCDFLCKELHVRAKVFFNHCCAPRNISRKWIVDCPEQSVGRWFFSFSFCDLNQRLMIFWLKVKDKFKCVSVIVSLGNEAWLTVKMFWPVLDAKTMRFIRKWLSAAFWPLGAKNVTKRTVWSLRPGNGRCAGRAVRSVFVTVCSSSIALEIDPSAIEFPATTTILLDSAKNVEWTIRGASDDVGVHSLRIMVCCVIVVRYILFDTHLLRRRGRAAIYLFPTVRNVWCDGRVAYGLCGDLFASFKSFAAFETYHCKFIFEKKIVFFNSFQLIKKTLLNKMFSENIS